MRRKRFDTPGEARFLTFSCYRNLPLFQNDANKDVFVQALRDTQQKMKFAFFAWVVMPEHVHLLLTPELPEYPVSAILKSLKQRVSKRIVSRWIQLGAPILGRITDSRAVRRFWQRGGGYDRNLISEQQVIQKAGYIHLNPIRRGLLKLPHEWRWSSAGFYKGTTDQI